MPILVYRGYRGGSLVKDPRQYLPCGLDAKFVNIQISPSYDHIIGRLCLASQKINYDGIKICLTLHLKMTKDGKNDCEEINMSEHFPIENLLTTTGAFIGYKKMNFLLNIPKDRIYPFPFISSTGSLSYRLVALITYDQNQSWDIIATKLLFDFKGYYNISCLEFDPLIDSKEFLDGKITSIFTITKPVLFVGRDTILNATLQLEGLFGYNVKVTVTLMRKTQIGENMTTGIISTLKHNADYNEKIITLTWNMNVPPISTATYTNELTPFYSVRYFVKYSAVFKQLSDGNGDAGVDGHGDGIVEVKVGTTCDPTFDELSSSEDLERLTLEANAPSQSQLSSRKGSVASIESYSSKLAKLFGRLTSRASAPGCSQLSSRIGSVASLQSQPPAYSQLSSRIGSIVSLETQPPGYSQLSSRSGSIVCLGTQSTNVTTHFGRTLEATAPTCSQLSSRIGSVVSLEPHSSNNDTKPFGRTLEATAPTCSQLSSRTGSIVSLEPQPSSYDDLDEETSV